MILIHKDGVQVMEIDDSAVAWEIEMFKKQGWSEPGYQCSRCGWVPLSEGMCDCIGKKEGPKMKYSIGDRVIVKESGKKGIVVQVEVGKDYCYEIYNFEDKIPEWCKECELFTDLTAIEKPFGLLSKEVQDELKAVDNGKNLEFYCEGMGWKKSWTNCKSNSVVYRLSPTYKQEEVKEMTVGEIEAKLGHKLKIIKGE